MEIENVRMMKSENGSLLVSETTMSPKVNDPSFGQYWIHFICLNVYNRLIAIIIQAPLSD